MIIHSMINDYTQVMTLTVFCLMVFAMFALQVFYHDIDDNIDAGGIIFFLKVYMGQLRNKCVMEVTQNHHHKTLHQTELYW